MFAKSFPAQPFGEGTTIPPHRRFVYVVGNSQLAAKAIATLRRLNIGIEGLFADNPDFLDEWFEGVLVLTPEHRSFHPDDVFIVASPFRRRFLREYSWSKNVFDASDIMETSDLPSQGP